MAVVPRQIRAQAMSNEGNVQVEGEAVWQDVSLKFDVAPRSGPLLPGFTQIHSTSAPAHAPTATRITLFSHHFSLLQPRAGEVGDLGRVVFCNTVQVILDSLGTVEDTKGNNGKVGMLITE